ncbi:hypothetical protein ACG3SK_02820 [Pseudomonas aeruginosa]
MPVDLPNLLLGLLAAAIPLAGLAWQLQRRASLAEREIALLGDDWRPRNWPRTG